MRFYSAETQSGLILDELPLRIDGELSRFLQGYGAGKFQLPTLDEACPAVWEQRTLPLRNMVIVVDDTEQENILWAGYFASRSRSISSVITLPAVTLEAYLLRCYATNLSFEQKDQALIFRALAQLAGGSNGINLEYDTPLTGVLRDRTYSSDENARVYQRLQELSNVIGGAAWTIDVEWVDASRTKIRKIFRTGYPMLGNQDQSPEHIFELPGSVTSEISYEERWGEGDAATHVMAVGDGEGESKLYSTPVIDTLREQMGWPRLEERPSFSGVTVRSTIDSHASAEASALFGGQEVLTFESRTDEGPSPLAVTLGDTARATFNLPHLKIDDVFNIIGYSIDLNAQTWKPTLGKIGAINAQP